MTKEEEKMVISLYGKEYRPLDIPAYIRERNGQRLNEEDLKDEQIN